MAGLEDMKIGERVGARVDRWHATQRSLGRKFAFHNVKPAEAKNLFTGLRLKRSVTGVVLLGALAVTAAKVGGDIANKGRGNITPTDVGEAAYMSYDTGTIGRKDMGATGDIVFGMHRRR